MKIDANDPKWTAYALGEITDAKERAEIESILAESAEMRDLVDDIRQTAGILKAELQAEPAAGLTEAQRERIEQKASAHRNWLGLKPAWALACAAAAVMLISFVVVKQLRQPEPLPLQEQMASVLPKAVEPAPVQGMEAAAPAIAENKKSETVPSVPDGQIRTSAPSRSDSVTAAKSLQKTVEVAALAQAPLTESSSSVGAVLPQQEVTALPLVNNDVMDLVQVMSGQQASVPKDGSAVTPGEADPNLVNEFKMVIVPTDAQLARGSGQVQILTGEGTGSGTGVGSGSGAGVGPGKGGGMGAGVDGGIGGGVAGGIVGGFAANTQMAPPPPPRPVQRAAILAPAPPPLPPPAPRDPYYRPSPPPPPSRPPNYPGTWPPPRYKLGWFNTESYDRIRDNEFLDVTQNPLSTFSIDVDTASYSNMRRFLDRGQFPPIDAVRIEEFVNYFDYEYKAPKDGKPFAANFEITEAPWNPSHRLLRIALKGREIQPGRRPNSNLVFLLDISGSMMDSNKLPLVKQAMGMLVDKLTESDRVAIVVYSTDTHLHLPATRGDEREKLRRAIESLEANGSTNGAAGIQLAYQTARENFIKNGVNRVILATDGDFNVGITDRGGLTRLIEEKAQSGIYLSALGFGMGNLKDSTLELLADKGHGNYAYIDTLEEAKKVLVDQMNSTLVAIAKDVKIQVEFNPVHVSSYRLIGYEDRIMTKEDFNDDAKEAGVIGAGHAVTAFYELVPSGTAPTPGVDPLKYQKQSPPSPSAHSDEVAMVKVRSKDPDKDTSVLSEFAVKGSEARFNRASPDFKFAASVAAFGMILRNSPHKGTATLDDVVNWALAGKGEDAHGYRADFIRLARRALGLAF